KHLFSCKKKCQVGKTFFLTRNCLPYHRWLFPGAEKIFPVSLHCPAKPLTPLRDKHSLPLALVRCVAAIRRNRLMLRRTFIHVAAQMDGSVRTLPPSSPLASHRALPARHPLPG